MKLRWALCWAALNPTVGQAGRRPVLVLSREPFNRRSGLVTVAPLATAKRAARKWEVLLKQGVAGNPVDSIVMCAQLRTISRERLTELPIGRLMAQKIRRSVAEAVLLHLGFADLDRLELEE